MLHQSKPYTDRPVCDGIEIQKNGLSFQLLIVFREGGREGRREGGQEGGRAGGRKITLAFLETMTCPLNSEALKWAILQKKMILRDTKKKKTVLIY